MNAKAIKPPIVLFPKFRTLLVRLGWLAVVVPSVVFSVFTSYSDISTYQSELERWIYIYLNFGSFVVGLIAAIIIFWRKKIDWLSVTVSLMLVTWTSTSDGFDFWNSMDISGNAD